MEVNVFANVSGITADASPPSANTQISGQPSVAISAANPPIEVSINPTIIDIGT